MRRIRRIGDVALVAPAEVEGCDSSSEEEVDKMREMTPSTSSRLAARISSAWAQKMGGVRPFDHASWLPRQGEDERLPLASNNSRGGATTHSSPLPWT